MKSSDPLYLTAYSPDDLKGQLKELSKKHRLKGRSVYLALTDEEALMRPFEAVRGKEAPKLELQMSRDAAQILPLPLADIVLDYQIGEHSSRGLFICTSRKKLDQYYSILTKFDLMTEQIVPYALLVTNYFLSQQDLGDKQCIVLDCYKPLSALLAVYAKNKCLLMRHVDHDSFDQLRAEIDSTAMSACANSAVKKCEALYIYGEDEHKEALAGYYKKIYSTVIVRPRIGLFDAFNVKDPVFPLHLSRNEILNPARIWQLSCALLVVLFAVVVAVVTLGMQISQQKKQITQLEREIKALK